MGVGLESTELTLRHQFPMVLLTFHVMLWKLQVFSNS